MPHTVVIIGAGPVGLTAAVHAIDRGLPVVVLEAGAGPGSSIREWGHVRLFSAWAELVDPRARVLLEKTGWTMPEATAYPSGGEWVSEFLEPLAQALVESGADLRYGHTVTGVARRGRDVLVDAGRDEEPFVVHVDSADGEERVTASAVIDASGTWGTPNPLGTDGYPAAGEREHRERIFSGIPELADPQVRSRYAGRHVAVAGTGASAHNVLVALARLAAEEPETRVSWLVRRAALGDAFGGGEADQLVERGALGRRAQAVVASGVVQTRTGFRTVAVRDEPGALRLEAEDGQYVDGVDEVIVVTGFRPDLSILSEVRLDLDPVLQAPRKLAPMIDPNVHSCGSVPPHGAAELAHPEAGFYLAGTKAYGRATSFLALTGFEQVRSIVAAIDGDVEAAARVELVLPETGVCGGSGQYDGELLTIGGPASAGGGCCD
ncbi:MAG TPA: FAD-dependent oxidoreductase [Nocardioides sp.]